MSDIEFVTLALNNYRDMALGDIQRAMDGRAMLGAIILAACCIDYLARVNAAASDQNTNHVRSRFESFVGAFMLSYNPVKLYEDLRCDLVHAYSGGKDYVYVYGHRPWHLQIDQQRGKLIINVESFVHDVISAYDQFRVALLTDINKTSKAANFLRKEGFLAIANISPIYVQEIARGTV